MQHQCMMCARHAGVRSFFRHAPRQLGLPLDMRLPIYAQREFSKSVWDMRVAGVRGVVNLVLIFADQHSSLAGVAVCTTPYLSWEMILCCRTGWPHLKLPSVSTLLHCGSIALSWLYSNNSGLPSQAACVALLHAGSSQDMMLVAGRNPTKAELSFRLKREDIERVHKPGSKHYYDSLNALIDLCNDLHDKGWDEDPEISPPAVMPA